jgi:vancomycin resistance protein YoaR
VAEGNPGALGITTRLAAGAASFTGAPPEHSGNARRAADAVTGYVVLTGEEFSFATAVGPVSERDGYTPELVGDNVRGLQGPWAGLSEASTAVYRAALRAGLPITQRSHAPYRVPYFEQAGQPLGTEAVVTIPGEDLRFVNDTQAALLVQVIPGPDQLRAEIYGAPTGRTVRLSAPVLGVEAPPGPPVEWRDPALPSGQTRRVAAEAPGGTVTLTRRLLRGAQAPGQDRILSQYAGLPEITARGTK